MSGFLDSQTEPSDTRLIGNNRIGYVVLSGASMIGAFVASAMFGAGAGTLALVLLVAAVLYGLFNLAGALRPKWLLVSPEGVRYRPVFGQESFVRWQGMASIDFVFVSQGFGVLTYRDDLGRSHGLGFWLDIHSVVREVDACRVRYS